MALVQIIFHQTCEGCTTSENSILYDFSKDFLLPFLLAGLAAYMVYWAFVKETKRDKQKEEDIERQLQNDNLQYFSNIISGVIRTAEQQNNHILEFVELHNANHVDFHLLTFISLNDLRRVTKDLNLEKYLLAYVNYYSENRTVTIKEFNDIITSVDFLHEILKAVPMQLKKAQKYDTERKLGLQSIYSEAHNLLAGLMLKYRTGDQDVFDELGRLGDEFMKGHTGDNYDLEFYYNSFFVPFNDFAVAFIHSEKPEDSDINQLAILTRNGKQAYLQIKNENQTLAVDFSEQQGLIKEAIDRLKIYANRISRDFS